MKLLYALPTLFILSLLSPGTPAEAHRLNVFAWLETDQILVDCNFGQDRPAINAAVTVLDGANSKEILDGHTNDHGRFSFPVPNIVREGHSLLIQVNAGQGHQGQWTMDAAELYAAASIAAGFEDGSLTEGNKSAGTSRSLPSGSATHEELKTLISSVMESHLAPIRKQLAEQTHTGPTLMEIIGGLGWIMGLAGIGLYFKSRQNREKG